MRIFQTKRSFRKEFKRQIKLAIIAAVGFTVAFSWREAIFNTFESFIVRFLDVTKDHYLSQVYTAIATTFAGVIVIFITSKLLRED